MKIDFVLVFRNILNKIKKHTFLQNQNTTQKWGCQKHSIFFDKFSMFFFYGS